MREISRDLRKARIQGLKNLIASYKSALGKTKDQKTIDNLNRLIKKAENDIKEINPS